MIDGILIVDKEEQITSYDVIRKLKKIMEKGQKIGHGGTLDPLASGLLVILLGKATKLMNTIHSYEKVYEAQAKLGFCTDTQDISGKILKKDLNKKIPHKEEIEKIVEKNFLGNIIQTPPMYSAKRVNGKRAYQLAREGKTVELKPKEIYVSQFEIVEYEYPNIKCKIKCSTGTYVRTLIHDLGEKLNTYATMTELRRTSIGNFSVKEAVHSQDIVIENTENILRRVINI